MPGMIVLIMTCRDKFNGTKNFHKIGTGMSAEATEWLIDKGIKIMGIDAWGWRNLFLSYQLFLLKSRKPLREEHILNCILLFIIYN